MLDFEYTTAVSSTFKDGALEIGGDLLGSDGNESGRGMKCIQPLGLLARPRDPNVDANAKPTLGAGLVFSFEGGEAFCWPTTDPRALAKVPPVKKGGTTLYSYPGGCVTLDGDNGTLIVLVPDSTGKKNHQISIDSSNDSIQIITANGQRIVMNDAGGGSLMLQSKNGSVYLEITNTGIVLNGNVTFNGGMAMGNVTSAIPAALFPAFNAWAQAMTNLAVQITKDIAALAPDPAMAGLVSAALGLALALPTQGQTTKLSAST